MHSIGLHSALAIKRQRKRREDQRKARERRFSSVSIESGLGNSGSSLQSPRNSISGHYPKKHHYARNKKMETEVVSSVGLLHIGVIFLVLGLFLIGSGMIPDDVTVWDIEKLHYWNELIVTGLFLAGAGIFMIVLNYFIAKRTDDEIAAYVERQLTRSKSGKRLIRDVETGGLTTKNYAASRVADTATNRCTRSEDYRNLEEVEITPVHSPTVRSPTTKTYSAHGDTPTRGANDLERILEEDYCSGEKFNRETNNGYQGYHHGNSYEPNNNERELHMTKYYEYTRA
ncbi:hypothetical protein M8J76_003420 [Diaphorina citri]|nr:hypothetical protein M8J76_003420 [Diaphorina citri]